MPVKVRRSKGKAMKTNWKKASNELSEHLAGAVIRFGATKRMMFGAPVYFVNSNMFAGVHEDTIFVRLSEADREEVLSSFDEAAPFEPMAGRFMKEYVVLPEAVYNDEQEFIVWLDRSHQYVASLPPKEPKSRKKS